MINALNNFPIRTRVISAFILVTLISALVIVLNSYYYYDALVARDQAVKISFDAQQTANTQQVSLQRMNALLQTRYAQVFATTGGSIADPSLEASGALINSDILTREDDFNQTLQTYQQNFTFATSPNMQGVRAIVLSDDPQSTISRIQQQALAAVAGSEWPRYKVLQDQELRLLNTSTNPLLATDPHLAYANAYPILYEANQLFLNLKLDWQQVVDSAQTIGEVVTNVGPSQTQPIVQATLIALLLTLLVIFSAGLLVNMTITRPLNKLVALTRRIGAGDLSARASLRGRDEIHLVASSMNAMLDRIVTLIEASEGQRARLLFQVEQLIHQVSGVSEGDLRVHATGTQLQDLGTLADSFNFMVDAFSSLIRGVKRVAYEVVTSTMQTSHSMSQLVSNAQQQIAQIQEASREVERMASASQRVAQRAVAVSNVTLSARESAHKGALSVRQTVDGMGKIQSTMRDMGQRVYSLHTHSSAIDEISAIMGGLAQRTQRLSLDAAIQANLAGATTTGFSAVAQEIRGLAEQARQETERIGGIARTVIEEITALQRATLTTVRETESMSGLVVQTGKALEATFLGVQRQADEIQEMSKTAGTQVQSSQKVVEEMQRVSQATQRSSVMTQQVAAQVTRQGQLILQLRASVEVFRVKDEQKTVSRGERFAVNSGTLSE